ncbi:MAG: glycosyltransferase [Anaerolineae bacterium]|nr:glycosyltransferase [Anaerolineae bacterium]
MLKNKLEPIPLNKLRQDPLVSVLMPNYNYEDYIAAAIESVLNQTYQNFEIVICDDGSIDRSVEIIQTYVEHDKRVKLITQKNGGVASAVNTAYKNCRGEIICLLDSDDLFEESKVEKVVSEFFQNPDCGLCAHPVRKISADGKILDPSYPRRLDEGWNAQLALNQGGRTLQPPNSGLSFRREIADLLFPIPPLKALADGYLSEGANFMTLTCVVQETLAKYRLHGSNISASKDMNPQIIRKTHADYVALLRELNIFLHRYYELDKECEPLKIENRPGYWESILVLSFFDTQIGVNDLPAISRKQVLEKIVGPRKIIWQILLLLPKRLGILGLNIWWKIKQISKKFGSRCNPLREALQSCNNTVTSKT